MAPIGQTWAMNTAKLGHYRQAAMERNHLPPASFLFKGNSATKETLQKFQETVGYKQFSWNFATADQNVTSAWPISPRKRGPTRWKDITKPSEITVQIWKPLVLHNPVCVLKKYENKRKTIHYYLSCFWVPQNQILLQQFFFQQIFFRLSVTEKGPCSTAFLVAWTHKPPVKARD